jgi:aminopeptidase YwaD
MAAGISHQHLQRHLTVLAGDIGVRLAGSDAERQAADYVAAQFTACGATVEIESFPIYERAVSREHVELQINGEWIAFPGSLFANTPGTGGQTVEAPLVFFEAPAESRRSDLSHLSGKAVVHLGCHIESRDAYRRLMEAKPAFILMVDIRYPGTVPLADSMFPAYTRALGAVPILNVAYMDAWQWKVEGATSARLTVEGGMKKSSSQNVVADLPGSGEMPGVLYVGGHHDTQAASPGADDNATGVAGILECARVLAELPRKHTIRLISFGCEEQLSVGSAAYARAHREQIAREGRFMFNLDSYGSHLGWNDLVLNGPDALQGHLRTFFEARDIYFNIHSEVMPYADHFPLVAAGVPAVTLVRWNCATGRFFHHRPDDDLSRVSIPVVAGMVEAVSAYMAELAEMDSLPFPAAIPDALQLRVAECWEDLFGGWSNPNPST